MTFSIELDGLGVRFCELDAVADLSVQIAGGAIVGLLGRNGAGKSTLLSVLAGYRRPTSGTVRVDGEDPYENPRLMNESCLVRESGDLDDSMKVSGVLQTAGELRGRWDAAYADRLLERFEIPRQVKTGKLSRGKRSSLSAVIGLAARAPLTMFDEPHLGMDAPARYVFYEELLTDYIAHPRTIVRSTHLIDEASSLFERVLIIDHGRLVAHEPADELLNRGAELTGMAAAVDAVTLGRRVVHERCLGPTKSAVVLEPIDELRVAASEAGVDVAPLPMQDLFIHLTSAEASR